MCWADAIWVEGRGVAAACHQYYFRDAPARRRRGVARKSTEDNRSQVPRARAGGRRAAAAAAGGVRDRAPTLRGRLAVRRERLLRRGDRSRRPRRVRARMDRRGVLRGARDPARGRRALPRRPGENLHAQGTRQRGRRARTLGRRREPLPLGAPAAVHQDRLARGRGGARGRVPRQQSRGAAPAAAAARGAPRVPRDAAARPGPLEGQGAREAGGRDARRDDGGRCRLKTMCPETNSWH